MNVGRVLYPNCSELVLWLEIDNDADLHTAVQDILEILDASLEVSFDCLATVTSDNERNDEGLHVEVYTNEGVDIQDLQPIKVKGYAPPSVVRFTPKGLGLTFQDVVLNQANIGRDDSDLRKVRNVQLNGQVPSERLVHLKIAGYEVDREDDELDEDVYLYTKSWQGERNFGLLISDCEYSMFPVFAELMKRLPSRYGAELHIEDGGRMDPFNNWAEDNFPEYEEIRRRGS